VPGGSSSVSIGELWLGINQLDEVGLEGASALPAWSPRRGQESPSLADLRGSRRKCKGSSHASGGGGGRGALIGEVCGLSTAPQGGSSGSSVKNKAARILADAPEAISPRLRRSFVDMQYSPSTGMD
jgi:hypothetical protein